MENNASRNNLTKVIGFVKEENQSWYADIPEYLEKGIGNKNDLLMVDGADTFLDFLSGGGTRVDILVSTEEFGGNDTVLKKESIGMNQSLLQRVGHAEVEYGAYYTLDSFKGTAHSHRLWLCPVTEYVFGGYYPDKIYIKVVNVKTSKTRKTIYHLIVDKSGSMSDCIDNTINGINEQLQSIKKLQEKYPEEELTIGITTFNDKIKNNFFLSKPENINPFTTEDYMPDGYTALLDAIGLTVQKIETYIQQNELNIPTTVVCVVITDGHENASQYFNLSTIKSTITRLEKTEKWTFSFLGAGIDAVGVAGEMAMNQNNSLNFTKGDMKEAVWNKLSTSMDSYINKKSKNLSFKNFFEK